VLDHVSLQCAAVDRSADFYDAVLATLGVERAMEFDGAIGYGIDGRPQFWIAPSETDAARELHVAFVAPDRVAVEAFYAAAVAQGAEVLHAPRLWPEYHETYFAAFVRDPDGNNVEAVSHG